MAIDRLTCEAMFRAAVAACDPAKRVRAHLAAAPVRGRLIYGLAIGKAALAMARGAGPVFHGVCVTSSLDHQPLPKGWYVIESSHPVPDERSLAAADAVIDLVASAGPEDGVLALISGGASALVERPVAGLSLERFVTEIQELSANGATIHELNAARIARSQVKGGKLASGCAAPVVTLVASDVIGDDVRIVGSGPTCGDRPQDRCELAIPMRAFFDAILAEARHHMTAMGWRSDPIAGTVRDCAATIYASAHGDPFFAWGEPTIALPLGYGTGGRAQQLALELAKRISGQDMLAFVAGSDGQDGPKPADRPAPAGAFVDGTTWLAIRKAGIEPTKALACCDAGPALEAVGALFYTQATGINHGDIVVVA
jgi:hydroxypyruvate reductase